MLSQLAQSQIAALVAEADSAKPRFATQKVLNQSPLKAISLGYEYHGEHDLRVTPGVAPYQNNYTVKKVGGMRGHINIPVLISEKTILTVRAQYWGSNYNIKGNEAGALNPAIEKLNAHGLQSAGLVTTLFKPLNKKQLIIAQFEFLLSGSYGSWNEISSDGITLGGSVFFAWKLNEKTILGPGLGRTYRMGRPIIIPLVYWYQTFNEKWGVEIALPARGYLRRNVNSKSFMMLGYELEGNQYQVSAAGSELFLQRGEIKPRVQYERQLVKSIWLSAQAGMRINGRFDFVNKYNAKDAVNTVYRTIPANPFYFNISINLVKP